MSDSSLFWNHIRKLSNSTQQDLGSSININTWFQHFDNLFSCDESDNEPNLTPLNQMNVQDVDTLNCPISVEEVIKAIKNLKTGKSGGLDGILSEMLKAGKHVTVSFLVKLFNLILDQGHYPSEWAKAIIVPFFKKGSPSSVDNYRGISLLSILSKCFTCILNQRLRSWLDTENKLVENQAGFRKSYSTTDQLIIYLLFMQ